MPKQVGVARYCKEHWTRWLAVVDDRDNWESTFEEWDRLAKGMVSRLRLAGLEVVWVDLEPDSFSHWCRERGYKNDSEARSRFAAEKIGNVPPPDRNQTWNHKEHQGHKEENERESAWSGDDFAP
jgi:hypothetical protein